MANDLSNYELINILTQEIHNVTDPISSKLDALTAKVDEYSVSNEKDHSDMRTQIVHVQTTISIWRGIATFAFGFLATAIVAVGIWFLNNANHLFK